jgi:UDP:flavonoid glycosyltransferase YjiC (YdhE family)/nucleoside-diphosphate-sugar epimerase
MYKQNKDIKKRILFIAESVTLAHVLRTFQLAKNLSCENYEVFFATSSKPEFIQDHLLQFHWIQLKSNIDSTYFAKCLDMGRLPFTETLLKSQIQEDIQLIQSLRPDVVVGDFRLSLSISARRCKTPYFNISNITWSPFALQEEVIPDIQWKRRLGPLLSKKIFQFLKFQTYKKYVKPFLLLANEFGVQNKWNHLLDIYADGDRLLIADLPDLVTLKEVPQNYVFCGPINYSIPIKNNLETTYQKKNLPLICINLGSSGPHHVLEKLIQYLSEFPCQVILSTAGKKWTSFIPSNCQIVPFIDLEQAAKNSDIVICSGGSASAYPCLSQGTPLLTIPSNLDQCLSSQAFVNKGVAIEIRPEQLKKKELFLSNINSLIMNSSYKEKAVQMKNQMKNFNVHQIFEKELQDIFNLKKSNTNNQEKKILITGAHGFIGKNLLKTLPNAKILNRNIHNIDQISSLKNLIEDVDMIIHLAGVNSGTSYQPSPQELIEGNVHMTEQLLQAIKLYNKKRPRFLMISSIHVYNKEQQIFEENSATKTSSIYAETKLMQEKLLEKASQDGIIESIIFRAGHIYGPGSKPFYNSAVATICHQALHGNTVDLYGMGEVKFDLTYINDLVKYIHRAITVENIDQHLILNLASGQSTKISTLVQTIESILNQPISKNFKDTPYKNHSICVNRLHATLGEIPRTCLFDGLRMQLVSMSEQELFTQPNIHDSETLTKAS